MSSDPSKVTRCNQFFLEKHKRHPFCQLLEAFPARVAKPSNAVSKLALDWQPLEFSRKFFSWYLQEKVIFAKICRSLVDFHQSTEVRTELYIN